MKLANLGIVSAVVAAGMFAEPGAASAQEFPTKPIQLIVPTRPGGDIDLNARILSKHLANQLSEAVVVVNVAGGGGNIGSHKLLDSEADGHTLLMLNTVLFTSPLVGAMDVDIDDFDVVTIGTYSDTNMWVTRTESPFNTVEELTAAVLAAPNTITYAATVGAPSHVQAIAYEDAIGGDLKKIDTGSGSDKIVATLTGQVDLLTTNYPLIRDFLAKGDMKVLGMLSKERSSLLPDLPTFKEGGAEFGPDFNMFYVLLAPKGTPESVKADISDAVKAVVEHPAAAKDFEDAYFTVGHLDGPAALEYLKAIEPGFTAIKDLVTSDKF